jgi:hypothetical protein
LEGQEPGRPRGRLRLGHTLAATGLLGLLIAGSALADKGDALREAVRNGTATGETEIIGDVAASTASKGGFVTRQSNIDTGANAGGAAIYGCRAPVASPESFLGCGHAQRARGIRWTRRTYPGPTRLRIVDPPRTLGARSERRPLCTPGCVSLCIEWRERTST